MLFFDTISVIKTITMHNKSLCNEKDDFLDLKSRKFQIQSETILDTQGMNK